jgi:hypothetical protein
MCFFEHYEAFYREQRARGIARTSARLGWLDQRRRLNQSTLTHRRQLDITDANQSDAGESRLLL